MKVLFCKKCKKVVVLLDDAKTPTICCGDEMVELKAGEVDAAVEKHVPVFEVNGNICNVKVGEVDHPMQDVHYIEWIAIETKNNYQLKKLNPGDKPEASFALTDDDEVIAAYAYCNLHGLWKK
ncbi:superoxide reductase [Lachnospiraceae bacterium RM5]|nr:superoxide reductase [Lachnospiraceae bacterium RM5]